MKAVKVQYTVKPEFTKKNAENICKVMSELRQLDKAGIRYSSFIMEDDKSFVHFAMFDTEDDEIILSKLASFKHFQADLKKSNPEISPKVNRITLIDSSYNIFRL